MDMERLNFKKLHDVEGNQQCQVIISNRFAALENLYDDVDTNCLGKILERISKFQPQVITN
jgi:hypothetical protein